jgi:hypothetical protein
MPNVISDEFGMKVPHGKLDACIASLEEALGCVRKTPFHHVLGRDFLDQTDAAANYLIDFHSQARAKQKVAACYFEMNGFTINWDRWYCDGFAFKKAGDLWELEWLASWDIVTEAQFTLEGLEPVQKAFADLDRANWKGPLSLRIAAELAEHLVTARFMELIAAAHKAAKRRYKPLKGLPILATAHDWDIVHESK